MMGFRGTNVEQDGRWGKADERLMKKMANAGKFSAILNEKIDMSKVDLDTIGKWCKERLFEILGFEDDIVLGLLMNLLQHSNLDGRRLQMDITGFLENHGRSFCEELWTLLLDASTQPSGIPQVISESIQQAKSEAPLVIPVQSNTYKNKVGGSRFSDRDGVVDIATAAVKVEGGHKERDEYSERSKEKGSQSRSRSIDRDRDRRRGKDRDEYKYTDKDKDKKKRSRSRDRRDRRSRSRDRYRRLGRDRGRDRDRDSDRRRSRSRERRDRDRDRDRDSRRDKDRDRSREKKKRSRSRDKERDRDKRDKGKDRFGRDRSRSPPSPRDGEKKDDIES